MNFKKTLNLVLNILIVIDIILITIAMLFTLPQNVSVNIQIFDFFICVILLFDWINEFKQCDDKKEFIKNINNFLSLIASIPFDVLLLNIIPGINILRYLRLLKLFRIIILFNRFFEGFKKFINKTNLDKIISGILFTVLIFTVFLWLFGSSFNLFESFYFVVVTLTTVGYGTSYND